MGTNSLEMRKFQQLGSVPVVDGGVLAIKLVWRMLRFWCQGPHEVLEADRDPNVGTSNKVA